MSTSRRLRVGFVAVLVAVLLAAGLGGVVVPRRAVAADAALPLEAAFYYPWFPETWHADDKYVPSLGEYRSENRTVMAGHVAAMRYGGLDAAVVSWWGPGHYTDTRLGDFRGVAAAQGFWAAPYYEKEHGLVGSDPSTGEVRADLGALPVSGPGVLRVGGRPVVFVYNAGDTGCGDVARWSDATGGFAEWYVVMKVFPGFEGCPIQPDSWHQYGPDVSLSVHAPWSVNVSPGFNKHSEGAPRLVRDLGRWCADVSAWAATDVSWRLVTSFNEWGEGTSVESGTIWESGSGWGDYLDVLRAVTSGEGCSAPTPSPTPTPTPTPTPSPVVSSLVAVADAWVREDRPTVTNNGTSLSVDGSPVKRTYVRFDVPGVPAKAVLRVHANTNHPRGFRVAVTSNDWSESGVTWVNAPQPGPASVVSPPLVAGQTVDVDVSSSVGGVAPGPVTLVLVPNGSDTNLVLSSRSGAVPPVLVVTTDASPTPAPTPTPTPSPSPSPTSSPGVVVWAVGDLCGESVSGSAACGQVGALIGGDVAAERVLLLGDLQYESGALASFNAFYDPRMGAGPGLKGKSVPAPGNHEYNASPGTGYYDYFGAAAGTRGEGWHAETVGAWRVVAVNSNCSAVGGCTASSPQGQFVSAELARPERCEVVFGHHPAFTDGNYAPGTTAGKQVFDVAFDGGADLYLSGHDHQYQRFAPFDKAGNADLVRGVRQVVSGAGGRSHYGLPAVRRSEASNATDYGAVRLVLSDGGYEGQFVNVSGQVLDTFNGSCH